MPTSMLKTLLCTYHHDPLDRLASSTPFEKATRRHYYCKTRPVTEIEGALHRSIVQHGDQLLAQQQRQGANVSSVLLATDRQRSVLNALEASQPIPFAYSPYGHRPAENRLLSLLGFNGERPDPITGHYHLGNGYRQFNPVLMRFNSPDSWSPFDRGGINAYMYCGADPVNRSDPTGHFAWMTAIGIGLLSTAVVAGATMMIVGEVTNHSYLTKIGLATIIGGGVIAYGAVRFLPSSIGYARRLSGASYRLRTPRGSASLPDPPPAYDYSTAYDYPPAYGTVRENIEMTTFRSELPPFRPSRQISNAPAQRSISLPRELPPSYTEAVSNPVTVAQSNQAVSPANTSERIRQR